MRVWRMYKRWRSGYWRPIEVSGRGATISDRLDAVEYELESLNRDLARIGYRRRDEARLPPPQHL